MTTQQGFPQIGAKFSDPTTGNIQQAWLQLLIQLWNRTGSGPGVSSATLEAAIVAISEQLAQITILAMAEPSAAGLADLAGAVDALALRSLQQPFFQPCCDDAEIAGMARNLFAAALMVARSIAMTGDGSWSVSFDGSDDVTGAMTLATVNADVGTYGDATHVAQVTVNAKGLVTAVTDVAISGGGGGTPGGSSGQIQWNNAGAFDGLTMSGDASIVASTGVVTLGNTTVTPGAYTNASVTFDSKGRATAASSGTAPPSAANPTATISGSAVNGSAATFMRSDAAPALANTAVTAGSYTNVSATVDAQGRITAMSSGAGGSGALTFVGRSTVAGAAAATITVSGLDLDTDGRYLVIYNVRNATNTAANISLFYNADTTATNYNRQSLTADGATVASGRVNNGAVGGMSGNAASTGSGDSIGELLILKNQSGRPMAMSHHGRSGVSHILVQMWTHQWNTAGTNVTGITLSSDVASSFAIGSVLEVWKLT